MKSIAWDTSSDRRHNSAGGYFPPAWSCMCDRVLRRGAEAQSDLWRRAPEAAASACSGSVPRFVQTDCRVHRLLAWTDLTDVLEPGLAEDLRVIDSSQRQE